MGTAPSDGYRMMLKLVAALPDQLKASAELDGLDGLVPASDAPRRILFCGMGGSAIAGDLIQPMLQEGKISLSVWRDYGLPHWTGPDDLVIAASYSGNTEETLSAVAAAGERRCARIAITSGGQLADLADAAGFPRVLLPGGLPPRASLGYGLGALARILGKLGIIADPSPQIEDAVAHLSEIGLERSRSDAGTDPVAGPGVGKLVQALDGRIPVIYTAGRDFHAVGIRWKAQFNENSKLPALHAEFPELDHNDLVGWSVSGLENPAFVLIILRGPEQDPRIRRRVEVTRDLLDGEFVEIHEIQASGTSDLARVMSLVQYGDFLSCHLAERRGVDPVPVERIARLKDALAD